MRIAVSGAAGAMGQRIITLAVAAGDLQLVAAIERSDHPDLGADAGTLARVGELGVPLTSELTAEPDVLIDFSSPQATLARARECAKAAIPLVIGTTGLSPEAREEIAEQVASRIPVLLTANMSLGVNLLLRLVDAAARALPTGYDVEIIEAHHRRKKDAPSGTAKELARTLLQALGRSEDVLLYGREGIVGARTSEEIAIHAVRGGDIIGDHTVIFAAEGERIELTHRASSRDVFARGALQAARFIVKQRPGLYSMQDVLASQQP